MAPLPRSGTSATVSRYLTSPPPRFRRGAMRKSCLRLSNGGVALILSACAVTPQQPAEIEVAEEGRVVVYSPHYDEPPPEQWGPLNCPGGAVHAIGRKGYSTSSRDSGLVFEVRSYPRGGGNQPGDQPMHAALVRFKTEISGATERSLPLDGRWAAQTDSAGVAHFSVAPGVYRVSIQSIGWRSGDITVRATRGRSDSVRVWIDQQAVC